MNGKKIMGLGLVPMNILQNMPPVEQPWYVKLSNTLTKINDTAAKAKPVVEQGKGIFDLFKKTKADILNPSAVQTQNVASQPTTAQPGMSSAFKVALGVAAAALTAGVVYKMSGKKGLGEAPAEPALCGPKKKRSKKSKK